MNSWNQHTLFRLLLFYIAGLILADIEAIDVWFSRILIVSSLIILPFVQWLNKKYKFYRFRWISGLAVGLLFTGLAFEWSRLYDERNHPNHFSKYLRDDGSFIASVTQPPHVRDKSVKVMARVIGIEKGDTLVGTTGRCLLFIATDSLSKRISYGDRLYITGMPQTPDSPSNPRQFDYKAWLANKNIHYTAWVPAGTWSVIGSREPNWLLAFAFSTREYFIEVFKRNDIDGKDFGVVTALILGISHYLDPEIQQQYSSTGVMHVLCVSGMHVGIIYVVLKGLLAFLARDRYLRVLRLLLLLSGVWFYTLLTGLAPSIIRAAAMFSFVIIGQSLHRHTTVYHSLTASAFFLMILNPLVIKDVGLQLSYAAVIAIVSIQPLLSKLWEPQSWLMKNLWDIITVSVAAQLGTFPLGLYYFNQFPNYFLIANIIALPLSGLGLYTGFLSVFFSWWPWLSYWIAYVLVMTLKVMNLGVGFIEQLPGSVSSGLSITFSAMVLLFLFVFLLFRGLALKRLLYTTLALLALVVLVAMHLRREHKVLTNSQLVVWAVPGKSVVEFINGNESVIIATDSLELSDISFQTEAYRVANGVQNTVVQIVAPHDTATIVQSGMIICGPLFMAEDVIGLIAMHPAILPELAENQVIDLVIAGPRILDPMKYVTHFQPRLVVIPLSVNRFETERWISVCKEYGIPFHSVRQSGAFVKHIANGSTGKQNTLFQNK